MQAKLSTDASGRYGHSGPFPPPVPIHALAPGLAGSIALRGKFSARGARLGPQVAQNEGLLNDARNLMGAIGLYCELLSMPGVLHPEHHHYAQELRLLGTRSGAMIDQLMQSWLAQGEPRCLAASATLEAEAVRSLGLIGERLADAEPAGNQASAASSPQPVSLQEIVKRCSGLLSRVANGRAIEIGYGPAASLPVLVDEEAVECILVNLVRNAAAAMNAPAQPAHAHGDGIAIVRSSVIERTADGTADETPGAIRIGVGVVAHRVDGSRPQPPRWVRLTVEDSGYGMTPEQLERVLCAARAPSHSSHGIGFIVVRELVAASAGDLRVMSAPGVGTRVQIEWPATEVSVKPAAQRSSQPSEAAASSQLAAAYWLPRPGQARIRLHAPEASRPVAANALHGPRKDCTTEKGEWTS
jgi:signal transduction histidine kinase